MNINFKVVRDDSGSLDVIIYKQGEYVSPLAVMPYQDFVRGKKEVERQFKEHQKNVPIWEYEK